MPGVALTALEAEDKAEVFLGLAQPVDAGDRSHDDYVPPLEEGTGSGVAQLVDLLVDFNLLFDEGVGTREIGFGLVVIIIADEVLHGVFGEELLELGGELGG
ncbi:hypothetical protein ES703_21582 [subsurface metagenome]